jgi:hypothetical protein
MSINEVFEKQGPLFKCVFPKFPCISIDLNNPFFFLQKIYACRNYKQSHHRRVLFLNIVKKKLTVSTKTCFSTLGSVSSLRLFKFGKLFSEIMFSRSTSIKFESLFVYKVS